MPKQKEQPSVIDALARLDVKSLNREIYSLTLSPFNTWEGETRINAISSVWEQGKEGMREKSARN